MDTVNLYRTCLMKGCSLDEPAQLGTCSTTGAYSDWFLHATHYQISDALAGEPAQGVAFRASYNIEAPPTYIAATTQ